MNGGRVFTSRYRPTVFFAPRPSLFFLPLVFVPGVALFKSLITAGLVTLGIFVLATYLRSNTRRRRPALQLSFASMRIEGLGDMVWSDVAGVKRVSDARGRPALEIELRNAPARVSPSPLWQPARARAIMLHTALLEDPVEAIEEAFGHFLKV
jgi:hypothetical protein